ncbi:crotonase/enoyl-CoA hydratase family protein [Aestuariirhabdus sp. Z084]|uniref:crotonase/enoyl-CoA hydratase family protein n=1 Tax=Aestuariirhabdus haliotis TaxID=2918751 RepID=UPI00201B37BC|nr:crotonase/enoyl-CoA hydratase family protein [Aestuariirhabdus haliotis]MCL6414523.1 crotonase/enoyl-CoA hydratase family protein [Aestuariirhabdus haliotis]MCL6418495.1 crotonase/enoyl-CoA hydratase family protein [Aestuariirhabdus haliotis]
MSDATVLTRKLGNITHISINRSECKNAVDETTAQALYEAFDCFDHDESASVAVFSGEGGAFCAGADLKGVANGTPQPVEVEGRGPMGPTRMRLSKPVIAAVEGPAVAGGLELALWCDLRVAARDSLFGVYCRRFGVPLVDLGTVRLPRLIGHSRAMDLILTGRGIDGVEAERIGLVNRLCESGKALDCAVQLATEIAELPQRCLRNDRLSAIEQWDLDHESATRNEIWRGIDTINSGETLLGAGRFSGGEGRGGKPVS